MPKGTGIIEKVKGVIRTPDKFFASVRGEKEIKDVLRFNIIISAIYQFFSSVIILPLMPALTTTVPQFTAPYVILNFIQGLIVGVIFTFIVAGLLHIFIRMFGGKGKYIETYKACVYTGAVSLLMIVPYIFVFGGAAYQLWALAAIGVLLVVGVAVWALYVFLKGISILHKISMLRALAAIIAGIVVVVFVAIIIAIIVMLPTIMAAIASRAAV